MTAADSSPKPEPVLYKTPVVQGKRGVVNIVRSETMIAQVQVFKPGAGELELHSHTAMDGLWFVLRGTARFYGENDDDAIEVGPHQAVFVPRDAPYWFENAGDDLLELLQVESIDRRIPNRYVRHRAIDTIERFERFTAEGALVSDVMVDRGDPGLGKAEE